MSALPGLAPDADKKAILTLALAKMRDAVDEFDDLTAQQRRDTLTAAASFLADLRAAGVIR